jgi:hypothetical protein
MELLMRFEQRVRTGEVHAAMGRVQHARRRWRGKAITAVAVSAKRGGTDWVSLPRSALLQLPTGELGFFAHRQPRHAFDPSLVFVAVTATKQEVRGSVRKRLSWFCMPIAAGRGQMKAEYASEDLGHVRLAAEEVVRDAGWAQLVGLCALRAEAEARLLLRLRTHTYRGADDDAEGRLSPWARLTRIWRHSKAPASVSSVAGISYDALVYSRPVMPLRRPARVFFVWALTVLAVLIVGLFVCVYSLQPCDEGDEATSCLSRTESWALVAQTWALGALMQHAINEPAMIFCKTLVKRLLRKHTSSASMRAAHAAASLLLQRRSSSRGTFGQTGDEEEEDDHEDRAGGGEAMERQKALPSVPAAPATVPEEPTVGVAMGGVVAAEGNWSETTTSTSTTTKTTTSTTRKWEPQAAPAEGSTNEAAAASGLPSAPLHSFNYASEEALMALMQSEAASIRSKDEDFHRSQAEPQDEGSSSEDEQQADRPPLHPSDLLPPVVQVRAEGRAGGPALPAPVQTRLPARAARRDAPVARHQLHALPTRPGGAAPTSDEAAGAPTRPSLYV